MYLGALVVRLLGEGEPLADVGDVDEAGRALHEAGVARVGRALGCNSIGIETVLRQVLTCSALVLKLSLKLSLNWSLNRPP